MKRLVTVTAALLLAVLVVRGAALSGLSLARGAALPDRVVVLISFDGFRWDYIDRLRVPNLRALAARGVHARELIPSFPTLTYPNHYTLVTGLYPAHHGIVSNDIEEPGFPLKFSMSADTAKDPRWWGGEPVWVTAIKQGRRAASMFWPGSEVPIEGVRPTYWQPFDDKFPNRERIEKVLNWLTMPPEERPTFISLYFSDTDHAGHDFGPDSPELERAAHEVDGRLGDLVAGIRRLGLDDRVDVVVVSDHGMAAVPAGHQVFLDDYADVSRMNVIAWSELMQIGAGADPVDAIYQKLHSRVPHVRFYRKNEVPARLHYRGNPRIAPIIGIVDAGWTVTSHARFDKRIAGGQTPNRGAHGYDPRVRDMHALFVAAGPDIRRGLIVGSFENVHVYDFLCALLGLTPAPNDGRAQVTRPILTAPSR